MTDRMKVVDLLGKTALFAALSPDDLSQVALELHERTFQAGQLIFARGDPGRDIYLVLDGRVRLSIMSADGRALAFSHASKGQVFGEIAALDGGLRTADATALSPVRAMVLSRASLLRLIKAKPMVAAAAIEFLCNKLRVTSEQLEEVALNPIEVRLARFLLHTLRMKHQLAAVAPVSVDIGMSQGELALLIGTSRQSVNAGLTTLERSGAVTRAGTHLECNVERLTALAVKG